MHDGGAVAALHHRVRGRECRLRIAAPEADGVGEVAALRTGFLTGYVETMGRRLIVLARHALRPHQRRAVCDGVFQSGDRRQRRVGDLYGGRRVFGGRLRFGNHQRHRLADEQDALARQQQTGAAGRRQIGKVGGGKHADYSRQCLRSGGVDAVDAGVRMGTGNEPRVQDANLRKVGGVT